MVQRVDWKGKHWQSEQLRSVSVRWAKLCCGKEFWNLRGCSHLLYPQKTVLSHLETTTSGTFSLKGFWGTGKISRETTSTSTFLRLGETCLLKVLWKSLALGRICRSLINAKNVRIWPSGTWSPREVCQEITHAPEPPSQTCRICFVYTFYLLQRNPLRNRTLTRVDCVILLG